MSAEIEKMHRDRQTDRWIEADIAVWIITQIDR